MLTVFPRYFSTRAIICYVVTLTLVSSIFINHVMPFQFMLFGFVAVVLFFLYASKLTMQWRNYSNSQFSKKIFYTSLVIRLVYVVFIYLYYLEMTGMPYAYHAGDEIQYHSSGSVWKVDGFDAFRGELSYFAFSDRGYISWLAFEYLLLGVNVLPARLVKCVIDAFSCVLMYNIAKRNFGEPAGRIAAVFYMLMPNMWYYCGVTLKECEMAFLVMLFVERGDYVLRAPKITVKALTLPVLCMLIMTTFRTAMAAVMFASMVAALIFSSGKQLQTWKKVLYGSLFAIWMFLTVGTEMIREVNTLWDAKETNQSAGYEWRANRTGGNTFAKYATASVFAPLIFTIPFSSMVDIENQENQMMMNGANFIKNILSGLTIFALLTMLFNGEWRKHVLPISLMCGYLVVLVFSNFAHSERFHIPVLGLELMFAAYGVTLLKNKHKRWYGIWLVGICIANIAWAWIKLAGRGMV